MPVNTVKVDKTTKWGYPFIPIKKTHLYQDRSLKTGDTLSFCTYPGWSFNEKLVAAARAELVGKNLACRYPHDDPHEDVCPTANC